MQYNADVEEIVRLTAPFHNFSINEQVAGVVE